MDRRKVLKKIGLSAGAIAVGGFQLEARPLPIPRLSGRDTELRGNVNHAACYWCYNSIPLEEFVIESKEIGLTGIDLIDPLGWPILQKHGMECSLGTDHFANIVHGFNNPKNHAALQKNYFGLIDKASEAGIKQVIVFSGNRNGLSDEEGLENCANGLEGLVKHAEKKNVKIVMELLNSKVDHKDYQCDKTPWGVKLVDKIGSPNFKLLYDIYHMQIMEGDVISTIRQYKDYIAHYHTGGVPGRNEINETQELNYPAIMKAIFETGYKGFVAQEFIPTHSNKLEALREGILICDV